MSELKAFVKELKNIIHTFRAKTVFHCWSTGVPMGDRTATASSTRDHYRLYESSNKTDITTATHDGCM